MTASEDPAAMLAAVAEPSQVASVCTQDAPSSVVPGPPRPASPIATSKVVAVASQSAGEGEQSESKPGTRSGTPTFNPPTPTTVNGLGVRGQGQFAWTTSSKDQVAPASTPVNVRWRDPMTVKYDGGQALPGRLLPAPTGSPLPQSQPQLQQLQQKQSPPPPPPPAPAPAPQQQQQEPQNHPAPPPAPAPSTPLSPGTPRPPHVPSQAHPHAQPEQAHHQLLAAPQTRQQQIPPPAHHPYQQQPQHHHPPLPPPHHQPQPFHTPPAPSPTNYHHVHTYQHHSQPPLPSQPLPPRRPFTDRPIIMDPPARRASSQAPPARATSSGFPSPTQDHARVNSKFVDDCTRMTYAIQQSLPEAVRRIVRDHWEKCLLGSEFHQAFILNASIHHAIPSITQRAVRDFGGKMVADSINDLIRHFTTADIDKVADVIIEKASDEFLDKCLEKRLLTIEALPLTNALAKAERLGYEPSDAIPVPEQHRERVRHEAYPGAGAASNDYQARPSQPPQPQAVPTPPPPQQLLQCTRCFRTFSHTRFYDYHMRYNVCSQIPPSTQGFEHSCRHCGQGFVGIDELHQHLNGKVCGDPQPLHQTPQSQSKVSRGPGRPPRTTPVPQPSPITIRPSAPSQTPVPTQRPATMPQPMPTPTGSHDPYAHLTAEKLAAMNEELHAAELKYAPRFSEAEEIQDENERRARIEGLRNSFGTKQSMIRKKYGVRLRERRTKAEISAERERLGLKRAEREERARAFSGAPTATATPTVPKRETSPHIVSDVSPFPTSSGWNAVNTPKTASSVGEQHNAKRRRMDEAGGYETPYKTLADETPSQPARASEKPTVSSSASPANGHASAVPGSETQPMAIDDDSSSSDDEDIPATLPESVRKGLTMPRSKAPGSNPSSSATPP